MIPLIILAISFVTHFIFLGQPASVVFDEVFYGNFMSAYWQGLYFFDQHPPFFKLLMAGIGYLTGASHYIADWSHIGNAVPDQIIILRLVPIIFGTFFPLVIYAICRRLDFSKIASTTVAILLCLENSLVAQSRFILPDIVLLFFGFLSILLYLEYTRRPDARAGTWFLFVSILSATATLSIKWTGLAFLLVIFAMELYRLRSAFKLNIKKLVLFVGSYLSIALLIYTTLFAIHFTLLYHSGPGDVFMTSQFQKNLIDNKHFSDSSIKARGFFGKFLELNDTMFTVNHTMIATHPYSSKWYTWPFMVRGVFYWQSTSTQKTVLAPKSAMTDQLSIEPTSESPSYIYLIGNPFIYWLSVLSIIFLSLYTSLKRRLNKISFFLLIGFVANLLPFAFIGRLMFLYHYEAALIFSIIAVGYLLDLLFMQSKQKRIATVAILSVAVLAFIYWSPITYGIPLTDQALASRMWLSSWR